MVNNARYWDARVSGHVLHGRNLAGKLRGNNFRTLPGPAVYRSMWHTDNTYSVVSIVEVKKSNYVVTA